MKWGKWVKFIAVYSPTQRGGGRFIVHVTICFTCLGGILRDIANPLLSPMAETASYLPISILCFCSNRIPDFGLGILPSQHKDVFFPVFLVDSSGHMTKTCPVGYEQKWLMPLLDCALKRKDILYTFPFLLLFDIQMWLMAILNHGEEENALEMVE